MVDPLVEAVKDVIREAEVTVHLPDYLRSHLAKKMIKENMIGATKWLDKRLKRIDALLSEYRERSKAEGTFPFILLTPKVIGYVRENYGEQYVELLNGLRDPESISVRWYLHFCEAVKRIGFDLCIEQESIYNFVTSHPLWKPSRIARKQAGVLLTKEEERLQGLLVGRV